MLPLKRGSFVTAIGGSGGGGGGNIKKKGTTTISLTSILTHFLVLLGGVYLGVMLGISTCPATTTDTTYNSDKDEAKASITSITSLQRQLQRLRKENKELKADSTTLKGGDGKSNKNNNNSKFPDTISKFVMDYATVPRDEFNEQLEIGVPIDNPSDKQGQNEVLILYTDEKTLPDDDKNKKGSKAKDIGPKIGVATEHALQNCHTVRVILQEPSKGSKNGKRQCIAIVPQWESWHIHKFTRIPQQFDGVTVDVKYPLRYVSRSMTDNGKINKFPLLEKDTVPSYKALIEYLTHLDRILNDLKPILRNSMKQSNEKVKNGSSANTKSVMVKSKSVVVMVCNKGQAHLFQNFVCNARSKGLDLSRIIMFATDKYTYDLCHALDILVYYDAEIFGDMPEQAARRYGDRIFSKMMMAKVYCVHLVMSLGYDVLFQDVDVIWHKNPLEYLITEEKKEWDMLFQDDGSRQPRYNPYSPNTGFYFVRNNPLTMYFFSTLLRMGDLISATKSHQAALAALLAEFSGWKGLRVKTWSKSGLFPGGVEYHQNRDYMKKMIDGKIDPFIFHMSWTENKDNKKLYYEQMGEWYTREDDNKCNGLDCCLPQANITCHYKDKPSKIPCKDSPPIDKKGKSFW